ncbi:MAG: transketolase C-terminal domain-containing protein [Deltaproteobacteria bacterium]
MKPSTAKAVARAETALSSLNQSLHEMMENDERVLLLGEDILDPYGGAFKVTKGLSDRFPERVFTTPISESAIVGMANGLAMRGLRPIAEIMFGDFLALAADQLINHAAKFRWMYNEGVTVPMVVRAPVGARRGYGPTHSQSLEKHFIGVPGLMVVAPHILGDPGALLRQATLDCDEPVVFVESKLCYGRQLVTNVAGATVELLATDAAPFPTSYLHHDEAETGPDAILHCYGAMTPFCLEAVEKLREEEGLFVDLAVFTQLSSVPGDHIEHIFGTRKPALCIYAEEASPSGGWGAELIARYEQARTGAGAPAIRHERVAGDDVPIAGSRELETACLPQTDDIVGRILDCF